MWLLDRAGSLNGVFWAEVEGPLDAAILRRALDRVQATHPLLQLRVEPGPPPVLTSEGVPEIPLRVERGLVGPQQSLEEELAAPVAWRTGPLVRAVLRIGDRSCELTIAYHHMIGDGLSGPYLLRDVLGAAADRMDPEGAPRCLKVPERPPLEGLLPAAARGGAALQGTALAAATHASRAVPRAPKLRAERVVAPRERRTRVEIVHVEPAVSRTLVARCRAEGVTLHGALVAALARAAAADIGGAPKRIACASPVNLRPHLAPAVGPEAGLFMSALVLDLEHGARPDTWAIAKQARAQTRAGIARGEHFASMRLQGLLAKAAGAARFSEVAEALFPATCAVSNIGRLDVPRVYGPLTIKAIEGAVSVNVVSGTSPLLSVTTFEDRLSLVYLAAEPLVSRARLAAIAERATRELTMLA